ncbi:MAG: hypothetical protein HQK66_05270, partial [Desulfamplus sp.]|nr:hypothetical protein [Desulfamplus sp.]
MGVSAIIVNYHNASYLPGLLGDLHGCDLVEEIFIVDNSGDIDDSFATHNFSAAGNFTTVGNVSETGNFPTAGNVSEACNFPTAGHFSETGNFPTAGNVSEAGNFPTAGNVSETGNFSSAPSPSFAPKILRPGRNMGFGAGVNMAAKAAGCDYLLVINPDVRLLDGCIKALMDAALDYGSLLTGPRFYWDRAAKYRLPPSQGTS